MGISCYMCGGKFDERFIDKPCPVCGKQYVRHGVDIKSPVVVEEANKILIPPRYIGIEWSSGIILENKKDMSNQRGLKRLVGVMESVHDSYAKGKQPKRSAIIIAPPMYSKVIWAYSCMQCALSNGMTVAPLLDTVELKRFMLLSAEKPFHEIYKIMDYESYITADVCFVTVTKTDRNTEAFKVILELLDIRSRKGLPTYIISRFDINVLSKWDRNNHFRALVNSYHNEDPYKYPAIAKYHGEVNYG